MKQQDIDLDNINNKDNGLIFKEHREFFIKFFDKRDSFLSSFALAKHDNEELKESYLILVYLIEATSAYIIKDTKETSIDTDLKVIGDIIETKSKHNDCYAKIKKLHRKISLLQVAAEILPKPIFAEENDKEQFWRGEDDKAMKEMKKAFYDVVMRY